MHLRRSSRAHEHKNSPRSIKEFAEINKSIRRDQFKNSPRSLPQVVSITPARGEVPIGAAAAAGTTVTARGGTQRLAADSAEAARGQLEADWIAEVRRSYRLLLRSKSMIRVAVLSSHVAGSPVHVHSLRYRREWLVS